MAHKLKHLMSIPPTRNYKCIIINYAKFILGPDRFSAHMMFLSVYNVKYIPLDRPHAWIDISALFYVLTKCEAFLSISVLYPLLLLGKCKTVWGEPSTV